jgi:hypothetical protein
MGSIQHDEACQLARGRRANDLAAKAALNKQRYATAMIEVSVREKEDIDLAGIEAKRPGIFLLDLPASLKHPAIDENAAPGAVHEVARAGDLPAGAVKRQLHAYLAALGLFSAPLALRAG